MCCQLDSLRSSTRRFTWDWVLEPLICNGITLRSGIFCGSVDVMMWRIRHWTVSLGMLPASPEVNRSAVYSRGSRKRCCTAADILITLICSICIIMSTKLVKLIGLAKWWRWWVFATSHDSTGFWLWVTYAKLKICQLRNACNFFCYPICWVKVWIILNCSVR